MHISLTKPWRSKQVKHASPLTQRKKRSEGVSYCENKRCGTLAFLKQSPTFPIPPFLWEKSEPLLFKISKTQHSSLQPGGSNYDHWLKGSQQLASFFETENNWEFLAKLSVFLVLNSFFIYFQIHELSDEQTVLLYLKHL